VLLFALQGFAGLWRGVTPAMYRAIPVNAAIFLAVEGTRQLIADSEDTVDAFVSKVKGTEAATA
jgi:solute carrier family 25 carnitine/acylcarnitine transporter 20/29